MQQRRLRLGDILDDYCPRERRITNHAVVAMIDDEVKQTRCTTCDADHEYKQARIPPPRRKKDNPPPTPTEMPDHNHDEETLDAAPFLEADAADAVEAAPIEAAPDTPLEQPGADNGAHAEEHEEHVPEDDGPVHRRLIRATLPRPEGQAPERKVPDFTVRQPGGRGGREFDGNRTGGHGQGRGRRATGPRGPQGSFSGPSRFGGPRQNSPSQGGQRQNGNRPGPSGGGQRGGGRPHGQQRGPGRKRGR
jgi:hypothetical protein